MNTFIQMTKVSFPDGSEIMFIGPYVYKRSPDAALEPVPFSAREAASFFDELEHKGAEVEQRQF